MSSAADNPSQALALVKKRLANPPQQVMAEDVLVDKHVAAELLAVNSHNRNPNRNKQKQFREIMARGRWEEGVGTIGVNVKGLLDDGQNRLQVIHDGDFAYRYTVQWGRSERALEVTDVGSKRSLAQTFMLHGYPNPNQLAATARYVWQVENGGSPKRWVPELTYTEYVEYVQANPEIEDSAAVGVKVMKALKVPASPVAAAHCICAWYASANDADDFFDQVGDLSVALPKDSPVKALRGTATSWAARGSVSRVEQAKLYNACVRGYDAYRDGISTPNNFRLSSAAKAYRFPKK